MSLPRTPDILQYLIEGCSRDALARKPAPDRFSISEALAHLHHAEVNCYALRLRQIANEPDPLLLPYDTDSFIASGTYSGRDGFVELTQFEIARRQNLELLAGVPFNRVARHGRLGPITVENLVSEWACHDLGHVRQVAELVRWARYAPSLGPWRDEYKLNP